MLESVPSKIWVKILYGSCQLEKFVNYLPIYNVCIFANAMQFFFVYDINVYTEKIYTKF